MARLDDTSDPTSQNWIDSFNPPAPIATLDSSANRQGIDYGGSWNQGPVGLTDYTTPIVGGTPAQPASYPQAQQATFSQPGYVTSNGGGVGGGGGGMAGAAYHAPIAPVHHTFQEFIDNNQAITDPTYQVQKAALIGKLNDYRRNVANQVGDQNIEAINDPNDKLLGTSYQGKALGDLYRENKDVNGDSDFVPTGALSGGTLGKDYDTTLANFNNQQQHGLRNIAEDFASRGMLGSGSGVWQTARNNAQDQYRQQLSNFNDSTINQYNQLLGNLTDQYSQGRGTLNGYLTDAANRMATTMNAGLPNSV